MRASFSISSLDFSICNFAAQQSYVKVFTSAQRIAQTYRPGATDELLQK
jgi:hypothetical protein